MTTVVRSGGKRESLVLLGVALVLGLGPIASYFTVPGTRFPSVLFGLLIGGPLFAWSFARLGAINLLRLSVDHRTFEVIWGGFLRRRGRRVPVSEVRGFYVANGMLYLVLASGERVGLQVSEDASSGAQLRAVASLLKIPLTFGPSLSDSVTDSGSMDG